MTMRFQLACVFLAILSSRAYGAVPPLLEGALDKVSADYDHWAYTQTTLEKNEKGKVLKRAIVRFDPSKSYPEQFVPLEIDVHAPDAGDFRKYRKQGERRGEKVAQA